MLDTNCHLKRRTRQNEWKAAVFSIQIPLRLKEFGIRQTALGVRGTMVHLRRCALGRALDSALDESD